MTRDVPPTDTDDSADSPGSDDQTDSPGSDDQVDPSGRDGSVESPGDDESASTPIGPDPVDTAGDDSSEPERRAAVGEATVSYDADGRREVELPLRLYKTVTVFSTLIAVLCVVLGFLMLDAATLGGSLLRRGVAAGLSSVGLSVTDATLSALFAVAGLSTIGLGAGVYVLGTRFRAPGMTGSRDEE